MSPLQSGFRINFYPVPLNPQSAAEFFQGDFAVIPGWNGLFDSRRRMRHKGRQTERTISPGRWRPEANTVFLSRILPGSGAGAIPASRDSMAAPISRRGRMILPMGLFDRDSSPVIEDSNGCPARMPDRRRIVVPELPASNICSGAFSPRRPRPRMVTVWPRSCTSTPRDSEACESAVTVAAGRKIFDHRSLLRQWQPAWHSDEKSICLRAAVLFRKVRLRD